MATLSLFEVRNIAKRQRPWTLRMECRDAATNTSKFWYATGRGINEAVEVGYGRIGSKPQLRLTSFAKFEAKITEKLRKGYTYVHTDYIRMSAKSLNMIAANSGPTPSTPSKPKPKPAPKGTNTATSQGQMVPVIPASATAGTLQTGLVSTTTTMPQHVNPSLPPPFGFIRWLRPAKGGGWDALDTNKTKLLDLPLVSGTAMLRDFPSIVSILA
jgi:predicted DNA-binding WGR domain protein